MRQTIEKIVKIPDKEWDYISQSVYLQEYQSSDYLIRAGEFLSGFFFIIDGLVRFFYLTKSGKEYNKHFAKELDSAGSYISAFLNQPCPYYIQAIEPSRVIVLPVKMLDELFERHSVWDRFFRIKAVQLVIQKEMREKEFLLNSAARRYQNFLKEFPELVNRLPQYHIASYLGITDVSLSRIHKKLAKDLPE